MLGFIPKESLFRPVLGCEFTVLIVSKQTQCIFIILQYVTNRTSGRAPMGCSLLEQEKDKLTARMSFASLRLSGSEPASTSLYSVFSRTLLPLNFFPSKRPSSKV